MQKKAAKEGGNKIIAFLKRNIYYVLMIVCVIAIGAMITVAAIANKGGEGNDVIAPPDNGGGNVTNPDLPTEVEFILTQPVLGDIITKFSDQHIDNTVNWSKSHLGIDISAGSGSDVVAPFDGVVTSIDKSNLSYSGVTVTIDHQNGYVSEVSLITDIAVSANQKVKKGDVIGKVISADDVLFEYKDSDHVHYELLKDSVAVDPLEFIPDSNK